MDIKVYEAIVKNSYDLGRAYSQLSRAELILRRLLENFEEDDKIGKELEEIHETLGFVLDKLEY
jgi:hypothetical protein